jgi:hypothetical protein
MLRKLAVEGHDIVVEGHTDDIPIHNAQFSSNWELSTSRATAVVQHMIQGLKMPPEHMAAIGYGEFHPLVPNDTDEHRAKNRRVVFFVKNKPPNFDDGKKKEEAEASAEPPAGQPPDAAPASDAAVSPDQPPPTTEPSSDASLPMPREAPAEPANP